MAAKYTPQQVANYFIQKAKEENIVLTKIKLMKLVYIAYAWYLYYTNEDLFDESIQAWKCGEVVPSLYNDIKNIAGNIVSDVIGNHDVIPQGDVETNEDLDIATNGVLSFYSDVQDFELVAILHEKGTPWFEVYKPGQNNIINTERMKPLIRTRAGEALQRFANDYNYKPKF